MASTVTTPAPRTSARVHVQKFGTFLSNMIMPNIGAIIAWGLITMFFIPDGFTPNEKISTMVGPTIFYLLPILIAYTGGRIVYETRGGVVGAMSLMGVILATSDPLFVGDNGGSPMFLGAMIVGPLAAWVIKKLDSLWEGKIKPGFEMLVDNFSAGIVAAAMAIGGMFLLSPILRWVIDRLGEGVDFLVDHDILPLTSVVIEPAKVMFLNNAINHGVLTPLGISEAAEKGKSVLFLLEANPGPGFGLLMAYTFFGRGMARASAPGAAIIQFLGGIHEVYFPFVLMKPKMILATIAGGMTGVFLLSTVFDTGLRAPAAPGSIFAVYAQTPGHARDYLGVTVGVFGAAAVSFLVGAFLLKTDKSTDEGDIDAATAAMEAMKGKQSIASSVLGTRGGQITSVVFACDAGMGSSAMGASVLRKKIQAAGHGEVTVVNRAIANLDDSYDVVVTHQDLTDRAKLRTPSAVHVSVDNFMGSPRYDEIVELIDQSNGGGAGAVVEEPEDLGGEVLARQSIVLQGTATSRDAAITEAGALLVAAGAVDPTYVDAMHEREKSVSTAMGNSLAIPHGTNEAKGLISRTGISFVRYAEPLDWNGKPTEFVIGIAGAGDDHLALLSRIAGTFTDPDAVARLRAATTPDEVLAVLDVVRV